MKRKILHLLFVQALSAIVPFILSFILIREAGMDVFGRTELLITVCGFLALIIGFSITTSLAIIDRRHLFGNKQSILNTKISTNILVLRFLLFGLSIFLLLLFQYSFKKQGLLTENGWFIVFYLASFVFDLGWFLLLRNKFYLDVYFVKIPQNVLVVLILALVDDVGRYYIPILSISYFSVQVVFFLTQGIKFDYSLISTRILGLLIKRSNYIFLSNLSIATYTYLDVYLISLFVEVKVLGLYMLARKVVRAILTLNNQIPDFVLNSSLKKVGDSKSTFATIFIFSFLIFAAFNLVGIYLIEAIFNVWNEELVMLLRILSILILIGPFMTAFMFSKVLPIGNGRPYFVIYVSVIFFYLVSSGIAGKLGLLTIINYSVYRVVIDLAVLLIGIIFIKRYAKENFDSSLDA